MSSHDELRTIALAEFTRAGYSGTSLQRIAELAGLSKSSVLYHYSSKEALLEAAIAPAIDKLDDILTNLETAEPSRESRDRFVADFSDLVLEHRLELHMFINQGASLEDVPVVERANALILRLATYFSSTLSTTEDRLRFGIALGGAAYALATAQSLELEDLEPIEETRAALITIVTELLEPVPIRPTSTQE